MNELTQHYDNAFVMLVEQVESLAIRIEALEQAQEKPVELEANVRLNEKSAKDLRAKIAGLFKF